MAYKTQSGFSMVAGVIAAVVVIGVIGLIGWRLFNQPSIQTNNAASNNTNTNNQPSQVSNNTPPTTPPATPQTTYLDIKELGVKITLNSQISDAIYVVVPTTDGSKEVGISAQSLVDKSANCKASNKTLGVIEATTTQPTLVGGQQTLPVDNKTLFKINNIYYLYAPPQAPACLTDNQADSNMVGSKLDAFGQAFTTLQLDH